MNRTLILFQFTFVVFLILTINSQDAEGNTQVTQTNGATVITMSGGKKKMRRRGMRKNMRKAMKRPMSGGSSSSSPAKSSDSAPAQESEPASSPSMESPYSEEESEEA